MPQSGTQLVQTGERGKVQMVVETKEASNTRAVGCHCRGGEAGSREALNSVTQVVEFQIRGLYQEQVDQGGGDCVSWNLGKKRIEMR